MIVNLAAFIISLVLMWMLIPALSVFARHVGLVDHPDNNRKLHQNSIPMVGGLGLFIAVSLTSVAVIYWGMVFPETLSDLTDAISQWVPIEFIPATIQASPQDLHEMVGLLVAATLLLLVGIADDRFGIRGRQKLIGQILAVTVLILFGYKFESVFFAGRQIEFGVFAGLVIYAWIIAAINSVNLLDGADGIASTIGLVMSLAICMMALLLGRTVDAVVASAIAGGLLGFLRFNFPPAKAYLGDAGSMLIGLLLSALAIRSMFKQNTAYAFFAPVALLAIPFIDTAAAIIRRRLTGRSIFAVDRGHLHHALMKRGYSPRVSILWVGLMCSTTAAGAVMSLYYRHSEYALASIAIVMFVMIACKIFGVAEYQLITRRARSFAGSFFQAASKELPSVLQSSVHVQGNRDWADVWKQLCDFAEDHQLNQLTLDLNAPWMHESFHATRRRSNIDRGENKEWFALVPLVVEGRSFGRVEIYGAHHLPVAHDEILRNLLKVTRDIELSLEDQTLIENKLPTALQAANNTLSSANADVDFNGSAPLELESSPPNTVSPR